MKYRLGDWTIQVCDNGDGHLLVAIHHTDQTEIIPTELEHDAMNPGEWVQSFTTQATETDYTPTK